MNEYLQDKFITYLYKAAAKYKGMFIILTVLNLILGILSLFHSFALSLFIDHVYDGSPMAYVTNFLVIYSAIMMLKVILGYLLNYLISKYNLKIANEITVDTIQYLQKASIIQIKNMNSVYLAERINSDSNVLANFIVTAMESLCMNMIVSTFVLFTIFILNFKIGIILLFGYAAYVIVYVIFMKLIYKRMKQFRESTSNYLRGINEQLLFIGHIQINNIYKGFIQRLKKIFDHLYFKGMSYQISSNALNLMESTLFVVMSAIILYVGGSDIVHGDMTIGQFTMIFCFATAMLSYLSNIINFFQGYQVTKTSYDRLKELGQIQVLEDGSLILNDINEITLNDVSFCYGDKAGIKNVYYQFEKGNKYLIHGENGSGKSTLINVIIKLYEHHTGDVLINQLSIDSYNMNQIRGDFMGIMTQESIFPESKILDYLNESCNKNYSVKEIAKFISKKGLNDFAIDFIELINKEVADMNSLSGGEKQKIDIIRMALKDAPVMIFDEPTAHLDIISTEQFYSYLSQIQKEKIIIIISHNENEKIYFERILDMRKYTYRP